MSKRGDEAISPENYGSWSIHGGEHCGVRINGPNGRSVLHVIQRDPHPTHGQGITQAEAEAIADRIVALWNASITPGVTAAGLTLLCQHCKADRYKTSCGDPHSGRCPMVATAGVKGDQHG